MSETAHKIDRNLHVSFGGWNFQTVLTYPPLERDAPVDFITTETGDFILLDGYTTDAILLQAYKIRHNTYVAVGGND